MEFNSQIQNDFSLNWDERVEIGESLSYGLEFMLEKYVGNTTGWLSYTLSKTDRQFNNLNNGNPFPFTYDQRHNISIVLIHKFNDRIDAGLTWVLASGGAYTLFSGKYQSVLEGIWNVPGITIYEQRNGYRMPEYHRLDLGITLESKKYKVIKNVDTGESRKVKKKFLSSINVSVYNLYARENAYIISFETSEDDPDKTEAVQLSLFKLIPSITYNFKF